MPTKSNNIGGRGGARPGAGRKKTAVKEILDMQLLQMQLT